MNISKNLTQFVEENIELFEDILDKEYTREHNTLTDLDRFV